MITKILIAAATMAAISTVQAHEGEHPAAEPQPSPTKHAHQAAPHAHQAAPHAHGAKASEIRGTAVGVPGQNAAIGRTVKVDMTDGMRFNPSSINVKRGETVRFIVGNSGKLKHELVLGSIGDLKKHADMMRANPGMEHAEENMVVVEPGKSGELIWKFTALGKVDFACLQPGHFEAGMKGKVAVK